MGGVGRASQSLGHDVQCARTGQLRAENRCERKRPEALVTVVDLDVEAVLVLQVGDQVTHVV